MTVNRMLELQERSWRLQAEGRFDAARFACREALCLAEESEGPVSADVANLLNDLAEIERDRDDVAVALALVERALSIEDALGDTFVGDAAARIRARTLALSGEIRRLQGNYAAAERDLHMALSHAAASFGEVSAEAAEARNNLGVLYKYCGRFDEGLRLYQAALDAIHATDGRASLAAATVYHNIGGILHARGDFAAAEEPARTAWEISRRLLGDDDWRAMLDAAAYAAVLDGLERYDESAAIYCAALAVFEKAFGTAHSEIATTLHNLAATLAMRGDRDAAERMYRRSLAMKEKLFGVDHPDVASTCNNLGHLMIDLGRPEAATPLLERAVAILETRVSPAHPHLALARNNLRRAQGIDP
jgi:tetratricopeptide (TPR) repeat protein